MASSVTSMRAALLSVCIVALIGCAGDKTTTVYTGFSSSDSLAFHTSVRGRTFDLDSFDNLDEYVIITFTPTAPGFGSPEQVSATIDGSYAVFLATGANYTISASRPGYVDYSLSNLTIPDSAQIVLNIGLDPLDENVYVKSEACGVCHEQLYERFRRSGHPYKLSEVTGNTRPRFPFSDIAGALAGVNDDDLTDGGVPDPHPGTDNSLGTPQLYSDISFVIGGFGWKARFIDNDGYIVTGSNVQFNLANNSLTAYHNNEVDKPFNCGNCHTTGWRHYDNNLNPNRQNGLPGMDGTFSEAGIQCEACHGAGSLHSQTSLAADITREATARTTLQLLDQDQGYGRAIACSECHTRDGEKDWPNYVSAATTASLMAGGPEIAEGGRIAASGGLIRHHEQFDEVLAIDPDNVQNGSTRFNPNSLMWDCNQCHADPHNTTVYQDHPNNPDPAGAISSDGCLVCHPAYDPATNPNTFGMKTLDCKDCHMPYMAASALKTPAVGTGPVTGDIRTHIFTIDLSQSDQFTSDGKFAYPYITHDFACLQCHNGVQAHDRSGIDDSSYQFHQ